MIRVNATKRERVLYVVWSLLLMAATVVVACHTWTFLSSPQP